MGTTKSTAVVTKPAAALAIPDELLSALADTAGQGFENAGQEDYALPFVKLLQGLSPQLSKSDANYIAEARPGDIIISTSGELFVGDEGIRVVPVTFSKKYLEYKKRVNGGGFAATYDTKEDALASMQDGNEIVDTANHFVLYENAEGNWRPACLSMSSSKLKVSRKWMSLMNDVIIPTPKGPKNAASFAKVYRVTSVEDINRKGDRYHQYSISAEGWTPKAVFDAAQQMRDRLDSGELKTDFSRADEAVVVEETGTSPSGKSF
jgi:hypothetical protein